MSIVDRVSRPRSGAAGAGGPAPSSREPVRPPFVRTMRLMAKMAGNRLDVMSSVTAQYGDAVRLQLGNRPLYFFNHPDHAKHVLADNSANYHKGIGLKHAKRVLGDGLLTSEGHTWKAQRKTMQPVFQMKRLVKQADALIEESQRMVDRLRAHVGGGPVDIRAEMTGLTLGVLGRTLLDAELGGYTSLSHDFEVVQDQAMFEMMSLNMVPSWVPLPKQLQFRSASDDLDRIVASLIEERRGNPTADGDDVLSRLLASVQASEDPAAAEARMKDEMITLLLAGHETTASTLSWAFHLLDQHPEVRRRLHEEAVTVLGDRTPVYDDLNRLVYTGMVVEEVMRLYPAIWILTRTAIEDDEIGGYHVPAGSDVVICPYTLHRNPGSYLAPDRFDPQRFAPDAQRPPRYAYIPFGAGPRFCVGNHLGMMEATFVLALMAREFRLVGVPGHEVVPEPMLSLRVKGGLPMTVHPAAA